MIAYNRVTITGKGGYLHSTEFKTIYIFDNIEVLKDYLKRNKAKLLYSYTSKAVHEFDMNRRVYIIKAVNNEN